MKTFYRLFNTLVLTAIAVATNAQTLSVRTIEANVGEQATLTVSLSNVEAATALQFNLSLPANVTVNESGCALGNAAPSHTLSVNKMDNGDYLFIMYNMNFTALTDGTLLTIPVTIGNGATTGNGKLYTIRTANAEAVCKTSSDATFSVKITNGQSGITETERDRTSQKAFDLQGHRLSRPSRGINIVDGRKLIVK